MSIADSSSLFVCFSAHLQLLTVKSFCSQEKRLLWGSSSLSLIRNVDIQLIKRVTWWCGQQATHQQKLSAIQLKQVICDEQSWLNIVSTVQKKKKKHWRGCYRLRNGAKNGWEYAKIREHLPLWGRNTPPLPPSDHWSDDSSANAKQHKITQSGQWLKASHSMQHIILETTTMIPPKSKSQCSTGTDLLNQYFLFTQNSIKRVKLHLWKAKDNDSTVNKGL